MQHMSESLAQSLIKKYALDIQEHTVTDTSGTRTIRIGDEFTVADGWGLEGTTPTATFKIIAFLAPDARFRQKFDPDYNEPCVMMEKIAGAYTKSWHANEKFEMRSTWHVEY